MKRTRPKPPPILTADIAAGSVCWRFGFAISQGRGKKEQDKKRRAFATYLLEWTPGVDVVEEWSDGARRWIVLETPAPVSVESARSFAAGYPHVIAQSFGVDQTVR